MKRAEKRVGDERRSTGDRVPRTRVDRLDRHVIANGQGFDCGAAGRAWIERIH